MQSTNGEWILSRDELAVLASHSGFTSGPLSVLPDGTPSGAKAEAAVREFEGLDASLREIFKRMVAVLASPSKVVRLNTAAGDTRVSRSVLAWGSAFDGAWVTMASAGELLHISIRSETELRLLAARHLAADTSVGPDRVGSDLSTHGTLTLLACCAQIRRARLISLLRHEEPAPLFSAEDVAARIQEAAMPDFRWPLSFIAELIPIPIADLAISKDPMPALAELVKAGLLEVAGEGAAPVFDLTEGGRIFGDGLCEEASRAALSVTRWAPGGVVAHDVMLFSRTANHLLCFFMSGETAFASTLLAGDLDELLKSALAPPAVTQPHTAQAEPEEDKTVLLGKSAPFRPARLAVEGKAIELVPDAIMGRKESNHVMVDDPGVSRQHARFSVASEGWTLTDLGSSNGTSLNGKELEPNKAYPLKDGDLIQAGAIVLTFKEGAGP
jgi:hypothetical protein